MACIRREILVEARAENVWAAVRDVGAVHERLAPGFVVDTRLEGDARVVTFANGLVARELIVDVDDDARRLSWAVVGYGKPLIVPSLDEAWAWWRPVTTAADPYLDSLAGAKLTRRWKRESSNETPGTKLHRTTYHYWFHLGESQAVRQMLGHAKLPDFVGGFGKSQYRPENTS